jgi:hypothetical protein
MMRITIAILNGHRKHHELTFLFMDAGMLPDYTSLQLFLGASGQFHAENSKTGKRTLFPPVSALYRHSVERGCSFMSSQPSESNDRECPVVTWKFSREGCRHSVAAAYQVPSHRHGIEAPVVTIY